VAAAFERAVAVLRQYRGLLEEGATTLLRQETLDRQDLEALRARLDAQRQAGPATITLASNTPTAAG
jgi:DNA-binding GntR family transcriptional regulator